MTGGTEMFNQDARAKLAAFFLFALMGFFQLIPLSLHPLDGLNDTKDCLLNTWILSWDREQLFRNPFKLFQANAFYPHQNTLAFSEHLLPLSVLALPVSLVSDNPVLAYNFVFFLSVILNGYAMFLLVRHLSKDDAAGLVSGIIFAFSAYPLQHIPHLQLLSSWLIPLSFLYLHKFFENGKLRDSAAFSFFFTLQALSCIYYGLFFFSILLVALPIFLLTHRRIVSFSFMMKLGAPFVLSAAVLFLMSIPYLELFRRFAFERPLEGGADLAGYAAAFPGNLLLGKILSPLGKPENFLFPGILAAFLAVTATFSRRFAIAGALPKSWRIFLLVLILGSFLAALATALTSGFNLELGPISVSGNNPAKPAFFFLAAVILYIVLSFFFGLKKTGGDETPTSLPVYPFILFWALFLSFGRGFAFFGRSPFDTGGSSPGLSPFAFFYNNLPGFKGIRVPERYAVFVLLSVAVAAGYGFLLLSRRLKKTKAKPALAVILVVILNLEYLSLPHKMVTIPVGDEIPETYRWLRDLPEDAVIVEVPFFPVPGDNAIYMYLSLHHRKKIVNGYSGFIPQSTEYAQKVFRGFPSWSCLDILRHLGVNYLILHAKAWQPEWAERIKERLRVEFSDSLREAASFSYEFRKFGNLSRFFGEEIVFELMPEKNPNQPGRSPAGLKEIPPAEWKVHACTLPHLAHLLSDNDLNTGWTTQRAKRTDDYLLVELAGPEKVSLVSLHLGRYVRDAALELDVAVSLDGEEWRVVDYSYSPGEFTRNLIEAPLNPIQRLYLDREPIRFIRISQLGSDPELPWSIAELKLYSKEQTN